jgi:hypothetical protein
VTSQKSEQTFSNIEKLPEDFEVANKGKIPHMCSAVYLLGGHISFPAMKIIWYMQGKVNLAPYFKL